MFRNVLIITACVSLALAGYAVAQGPPPSPPGQGECEHGNSEKPCRPDPQPDKGKDCEEHGPNEGGINEDHCLGATTTGTTTTGTTTTGTTETTTTGETTSTITTSPATTPSVTTGQTTTTTGSTPTTTTTPPSTTPPSIEEELEEFNAENGAITKGAVKTDKLPYTGLGLLDLLMMGSFLVTSGMFLRYKGQE